jgi:hypothetical protein
MRYQVTENQHYLLLTYCTLCCCCRRRGIDDKFTFRCPCTEVFRCAAEEGGAYTGFLSPRSRSAIALLEIHLSRSLSTVEILVPRHGHPMYYCSTSPLPDCHPLNARQADVFFKKKTTRRENSLPVDTQLMIARLSLLSLSSCCCSLPFSAGGDGLRLILVLAPLSSRRAHCLFDCRKQCW